MEDYLTPHVYTITNIYNNLHPIYIPSKKELETPWWRRFENQKRKKKK